MTTHRYVFTHFLREGFHHFKQQRQEMFATLRTRCFPWGEAEAALHVGCLLPMCLSASMLLVSGRVTHGWVTPKRPPSHIPLASCIVTAAMLWMYRFIFEILSHFSHLRGSLQKHRFWDIGYIWHLIDFMGLPWLTCSHGCFSHPQ